MPAQGQYAPQSQNIQPGEEVSPEAYALQGTPDVPISQAQTALASAPTVSPAATVDPSLIGTATPAATAQQGTVSQGAQVTGQQGTVSQGAQAQAAQTTSKGQVAKSDTTARAVTAPEVISGAVADTAFLGDTTAAQSDFVSNLLLLNHNKLLIYLLKKVFGSHRQ